MEHPPIPADHESLPKNAAEVMVMLRDQIGFALPDIIGLDLQTLHNLVAINVPPEDAALAERLVVVDDDTLEVLDEVVTGEIARARPDRRTEEGYEGWISRSQAEQRVCVAPGSTLTEIEAALARVQAKNDVVLEDQDYRRVMAALNEAISSRPHGRSPTVGGGAIQEAAMAAARSYTAKCLMLNDSLGFCQDRDPGFDVVAASRFVEATQIAMTSAHAAGHLPNNRPVVFGSARTGEEKRLLALASAEGNDLVCLGFEPGFEDQGPCNIAVYEVRDGYLNVWSDCDPVQTSDPTRIVLHSRIFDVCFSYDGRAIVAVTGASHCRTKSSILQGHATIRRIAAALTRTPSSGYDG